MTTPSSSLRRRSRARPRTRPRVGRPEGFFLPVASLFLLTAALEIGLGVVAYEGPTGLTIGILLAVLTPWGRVRLGPWLALVVLALGQFERPAALSWRLLGLLGGLHLLHVLAASSARLPWRARLSPDVLVRPVRRFFAIQVPVQLFAVGVLTLLTSHGHLRLISREPGFALLALAGFAVLTGLMFGLASGRRCR